MGKFNRNPVVAAASILIVLVMLGLLSGLVATRLTGSYTLGLVASNIGTLLGILMAWRFYRSEKGT